MPIGMKFISTKKYCTKKQEAVARILDEYKNNKKIKQSVNKQSRQL